MNRDNYERNQDAIEQSAFIQARFATKQCYQPGCTADAISSHILQKKGALSLIATKGKFRQLTKPTPFRPLGFYPTGIRETEVFTFNGFCNPHDTSEFSKIENGASDFTSYEHQIILSYRGLLNDLFNAEVAVDYINILNANPEYSGQRKNNLLQLRLRRMAAVKDLNYYKLLFEKEIANPSNMYFPFHRFELPRVEIATSAIFGSAFYWGLNEKFVAGLQPDDLNYTPLSKPIFVNIVPQVNSSIFVIGYAPSVESVESVPVTSIAGMNMNDVFKWISVMLLRTQTWGLSEVFYNKLKNDSKIDQYLSLHSKWLKDSVVKSNNPEVVNNSSVSEVIAIPADYNLFDSIN